MLKCFTSVAALLILGCALSAHADPLPYAFNAQGGYPSIGLTGTFQYDPTDGSVSGATLFLGVGPSFPFIGTRLDDSIYLEVDFRDLVNGPMGTQGYTAEILLDIANPAAPTVCLYQGSCPYASTVDEYFGGQRYGSFELTSGTLTAPPPPPPPTPAPEPSSLLLLGTGGLAVVGVARRRFR